MRTFSGRDLLRIGNGLDRTARERAGTATEPTDEQRVEAAERDHSR